VRQLGLMVAVIVALYAVRSFVLPRVLSPGDVEYRGERITLSRWYPDYDDYKNDPENIAPSERARVQGLVTTAPIARAFQARLDMLKALSSLRFPGYGSTQFGETLQSDGTLLSGFSIEVPMANQERILVFRARDGHYSLVDDFVVPGDQFIGSVRAEGEQLVYSTRQGREVLRRSREIREAAQQGVEADEAR
jgi:hypothetical protein